MQKLHLIFLIIMNHSYAMDKKPPTLIAGNIVTKDTIKHWDSYALGLKIIVLRQINEFLDEPLTLEAFEQIIHPLKKIPADIPGKAHHLEQRAVRSTLPSVKTPGTSSPAELTNLNTEQSKISEQITGTWYWNARPKNSGCCNLNKQLVISKIS